MAKAKPNPEARIATAALHLAARKNWKRLTLEEIARAAKLPLPQVKKQFAEIHDILPAIVRLVDAETAAGAGKPDSKAAPQDRLFEVLMARMDALQAHRRAILGIMEDARRDPGMARRLVPAQAQAMRKMLDLAGLKPDRICEPFAIAGLLGIYGLGLCAWRKDQSPDMSRTMAALDRYLRRAVPIAETLFRRT